MPILLQVLPVDQDIEIIRGTDNTLQFQIKDADGFPVNINADDVTFTARAGFAGAEKIATKTVAAGAHVNPAAGITEFDIARTEIDDEVSSGSAETWLYEVRRHEGGPGGDETVEFQGELRIKPAVTES